MKNFWTCKKCGTINGKNRSVCEVCDSPQVSTEKGIIMSEDEARVLDKEIREEAGERWDLLASKCNQMKKSSIWCLMEYGDPINW